MIHAVQSEDSKEFQTKFMLLSTESRTYDPEERKCKKRLDEQRLGNLSSAVAFPFTKTHRDT
jgi:hypothetical protein